MNQVKKPNLFVRIIRFPLVLIFFVLAVLFNIYAGWNVLKFAFYADYYAINTTLNKNPGLDDNYVPQGCHYLESKNMYLTSGYMTSKKLASRVYSIDEKQNVHHCEVYKNDKICTYHFGGMAVYENYVLLASANAIQVLDLDTVLTKEKADILFSIKVNNNASFIFVRDDACYVGEFHLEPDYQTEHEKEMSDKTVSHAIVSRYDCKSLFKDNEEHQEIKPEAIYYIPDRIQGFCVTSSSHFVLSDSFGLASSKFYIYQNPEKVDETDGGVSTYYLDSRYLEKTVTGPAMAEDLDYYDGKVIYCSESASNKYIFGKLFYYTDINGLTID
ncbi:hypothetical protein DYE49_02775 [Treponema rectale]|uniref:Uncharacterized protein n=1 Tax=Treponema rectale TaxID=744512 RepID=A0A7M1XKP6_9SPIR|nr:hypothetical protein DYE49_02775 [Treponema rectale]